MSNIDANMNTDTNPYIKKTSQCEQGTLNINGQDSHHDKSKNFGIFSKRSIDFFMKKNNLDKHDIYVQAMLTGCEEYQNQQSEGERKRKRNKIESVHQGTLNAERASGQGTLNAERVSGQGTLLISNSLVKKDNESDYMDVDIDIE